MELWSRLAVGVIVTVCLAGAQSQPAVSPPAPGVQNTENSAPAAPSPAAQPAGSSSAGCPAGASWFCVTQTLQRLMFNMNGTHKPDSEIAETVPQAIERLVRDGVMKPENAPKSPIQGFEDANQFLLHYPSDAPQASAASSQNTAAAGENTSAAGSGDCPKDQPWLCPVAGAPPPPAARKSAAASARRAAQAAAPAQKAAVNKSPAPQSTQQDSTGKIASQTDKTPFYVYGANDVVGITVAGEPTVSGQYVIMPDGRMSLPLIHEFKAAGLTGPQLTDIITDKLREDGGILEPVVNVQLLRSNSKHYTVFGAVMKPGPFPLIEETTLLDALSMAGFQEFAKKDKITVRRGNKIIVTFNFKKAVSKGEGLDKNITLEDGDYIYVPGD
jgi:polysaccharide export outer membrane protein